MEEEEEEKDDDNDDDDDEDDERPGTFAWSTKEVPVHRKEFGEGNEGNFFSFFPSVIVVLDQTGKCKATMQETPKEIQQENLLIGQKREKRPDMRWQR